ncbi:MAG: hypothetical protein AAF806_23405, partial [Bacteroidota bacterium]
MKYLLLVLALLPSLFLFSQKHDHIWRLGYSGGTGGSAIDSFGISILDFNYDTLNIYSEHISPWGFDSANTSMCDAQGNYQFSSNGIVIIDKEGKWMEGEVILNEIFPEGYKLPQGVLALPHPRDSNLYAFFHGTKGHLTWVTETWYSEIDMRENERLGGITYMESLVNDTLVYGQYTAVRHGNGRDWWIPMQHYCRIDKGCQNNFFYTTLLTLTGVEVFEQKIKGNLLTETGLGQAVFTPDGTKYITPHGIRASRPIVIDIYNFDRCTGEFGNRQQIEFFRVTEDTHRGSALAISPNSRFIYLITWTQIIQYDLQAEDIQASETIVAEYDGFVQYTDNGFPLATRFLRGQLAPDDKIYICTTNSTQYLHVIHNPNEKGLACNVEQHGIYLPTLNAFSIPNHPNYRLGTWEGSPCDTLSPISSTEQVAYNEMNFFPNPSTGFFQLELD